MAETMEMRPAQILRLMAAFKGVHVVGDKKFIRLSDPDGKLRAMLTEMGWQETEIRKELDGLLDEK